MALVRGLKDSETAILGGAGILSLYLLQSGWIGNMAGRVAGQAGYSFANSFFGIEGPAPRIDVPQFPTLPNSTLYALPLGLINPFIPVAAGIGETLSNMEMTPSTLGLLPGQNFTDAYPGYESTSLWDRFRLGWNVSPLGGYWALQ